MSKTEEQFNAADADRRRFLTLVGKLGLLMAPVVTLTLTKPSYAAGGGFSDPPWWRRYGFAGPCSVGPQEGEVGELTIAYKTKLPAVPLLGLGSEH